MSYNEEMYKRRGSRIIYLERTQRHKRDAKSLFETVLYYLNGLTSVVSAQCQGFVD